MMLWLNLTILQSPKNLTTKIIQLITFLQGIQFVYNLFQNGRHLNFPLFLFKLALDASFLSLKFKRIFYVEQGNKGQFVCA